MHGVASKNERYPDYLKGMEDYSNIWDKVFKNGPSNIYGRQPLQAVL